MRVCRTAAVRRNYLNLVRVGNSVENTGRRKNYIGIVYIQAVQRLQGGFYGKLTRLITATYGESRAPPEFGTVIAIGKGEQTEKLSPQIVVRSKEQRGTHTHGTHFSCSEILPRPDRGTCTGICNWNSRVGAAVTACRPFVADRRPAFGTTQNQDYKPAAPYVPPAKEGFWGRVNPFARKSWVKKQTDPINNRLSELDEVNAKNARDIQGCGCACAGWHQQGAGSGRRGQPDGDRGGPAGAECQWHCPDRIRACGSVERRP